jgi:hypothetical protein
VSTSIEAPVHALEINSALVIGKKEAAGEGCPEETLR